MNFFLRANIKKPCLDPACVHSGPDLLPEVRGRRSERARDNLIKVLVREERRRCQQQQEATLGLKHRSNSFTLHQHTHQHFLSRSRWTKLDFPQPDWNSNSFPSSCWGGPQETGSTENRKYHGERGGGSTLHHHTLYTYKWLFESFMWLSLTSFVRI